MDNDNTYRNWLEARSHVSLSADFAERAMEQIGQLPGAEPAVKSLGRLRWLVRVGLYAAAGLVAMVQMVELLSVFATSGIVN